MNNEMCQKGFRALGDPTRLHIVEFLSKQCCRQAEIDEQGAVYGPTAGEVCCHITGAEKITSTISHHLHELESAGLVNLERSGKNIQCSLRPESLLALSTALTELANGEGTEPCCTPAAGEKCCDKESACC